MVRFSSALRAQENLTSGMTMSTLLAFDTSIGKCSVALFHQGRTSSLTADTTFSQSEQLFPLINSLLASHLLTLKDVDVIACTIGPGSFTGVRIGIAAARGIKKVFPKIRLIGITTLELIASSVEQTPATITALIESRVGEFYTQRFDSDLNPLSDTALTQDLTSLPAHDVIVSTVPLPGAMHVEITAELLLQRALVLANLQAYSQTLKPLYVKQPNIGTKS